MAARIDPADRVFSQYIRIKQRKCQRCGSPVEFNANGLPISHQASHFQRRGKENTRFDEENVDTLCENCHAHFTANPKEHYAWQVKQKGQEKVNEIILKSHQYKNKDRDEAYKYWRKRLKDLRASVSDF